MLTSDILYWILFAVPSILIASTIHEYFHAWSAYQLGDITPMVEGRLTLNPLAHIDPIGALMMIIFRFGWSKPVPVNPYNFEHRDRDMALVALAGPLSNLLLAMLSGLLNLIINVPILNLFLLVFASINISLAVFNILPIPPLDGHKIVKLFIPERLKYYWDKLENYSWIIFILILLPLSPVGNILTTFIITVLEKSLILLGFY